MAPPPQDEEDVNAKVADKEALLASKNIGEGHGNGDENAIAAEEQQMVVKKKKKKKKKKAISTVNMPKMLPVMAAGVAAEENALSILAAASAEDNKNKEDASMEQDEQQERAGLQQQQRMAAAGSFGSIKPSAAAGTYPPNYYPPEAAAELLQKQQQQALLAKQIAAQRDTSNSSSNRDASIVALANSTRRTLSTSTGTEQPYLLPSELADKETMQYHVICGRGKGAYNRAGNKKCRDIVKQYVPRYLAAKNKHTKGIVLDDILHQVQQQSNGRARFIKLVKQDYLDRHGLTPPPDHGDTFWVVQPHEQAREKVGHMMRESMNGPSSSSKSSPTSQRASPAVAMAMADDSSSQRGGSPYTASSGAIPTGPVRSNGSARHQQQQLSPFGGAEGFPNAGVERAMLLAQQESNRRKRLAAEAAIAAMAADRPGKHPKLEHAAPGGVNQHFLAQTIQQQQQQQQQLQLQVAAAGAAYPPQHQGPYSQAIASSVRQQEAAVAAKAAVARSSVLDSSTNSSEAATAAQSNPLSALDVLAAASTLQERQRAPPGASSDQAALKGPSDKAESYGQGDGASRAMGDKPQEPPAARYEKASPVPPGTSGSPENSPTRPDPFQHAYAFAAASRMRARPRADTASGAAPQLLGGAQPFPGLLPQGANDPGSLLYAPPPPHLRVVGGNDAATERIAQPAGLPSRLPGSHAAAEEALRAAVAQAASTSRAASTTTSPSGPKAASRSTPNSPSRSPQEASRTDAAGGRTSPSTYNAMLRARWARVQQQIDLASQGATAAGLQQSMANDASKTFNAALAAARLAATGTALPPGFLFDERAQASTVAATAAAFREARNREPSGDSVAEASEREARPEAASAQQDEARPAENDTAEPAPQPSRVASNPFMADPETRLGLPFPSAAEAAIEATMGTMAMGGGPLGGGAGGFSNLLVTDPAFLEQMANLQAGPGERYVAVPVCWMLKRVPINNEQGTRSSADSTAGSQSRSRSPMNEVGSKASG